MSNLFTTKDVEDLQNEADLLMNTAKKLDTIGGLVAEENKFGVDNNLRIARQKLERGEDPVQEVVETQALVFKMGWLMRKFVE